MSVYLDSVRHIIGQHAFVFSHDFGLKHWVFYQLEGGNTMPKWTANDIPNQDGKIAVVTGANSGIGLETARALASKGATVSMACRSEQRGNAAAQEIRDEYPEATVECLQLDLADLASIGKFAEEFSARYDQLHLLINNAGVMMIPELRRTADGFEMQFGTNHLGHFALTGKLLATIKRTPGARVARGHSETSGHGRGVEGLKIWTDARVHQLAAWPGTSVKESVRAGVRHGCAA